MKLKEGDKVQVIAGKERGKSSTVVRILPKEELVILDGLNLSKRHQKSNARNKKGQIIERAMPMHASNVMLLDPKSGKPTRIRFTRDGKGNRMRIAVRSGQEIK